MPIAEPTCATCRFWKRIDTMQGECFRYPPTTVYVPHTFDPGSDRKNNRPITTTDEFCGERQAAVPSGDRP